MSTERLRFPGTLVTGETAPNSAISQAKVLQNAMFDQLGGFEMWVA